MYEFFEGGMNHDTKLFYPFFETLETIFAEVQEILDEGNQDWLGACS